MKKTIYILGFLMVLFSCKDNETDLSALENEIETLKEDLRKQQGVISLMNACNAGKIIVSVVMVGEEWNITFSDNTVIIVPSSVVLGVESDDGVYILTLYDEQRLTFNGKDVVYPTSVVALTTGIKFLKNAEVAIEFQVNPSNAIFNYDVASPDCRVEIDVVGRLNTDTNPDKFRLTRIEQVSDADGNVVEGQYRAYIRDNNGDETYKYATAVVLTTKDKNNDTVRLSSAAITVERKANTNLPVVAIHTENRAEIEDKENWIRAKMTIDGVGKFDDYEGTDRKSVV